MRAVPADLGMFAMVPVVEAASGKGEEEGGAPEVRRRCRAAAGVAESVAASLFDNS